LQFAKQSLTTKVSVTFGLNRERALRLYWPHR